MADRGSFFIVDVPTFAKVCELGDADAAASYLILAAGTGGDNRTSSWSREAINQRTALNWRKASAAVDKLEQHGFVRWKTPKSDRRPRLYLPPFETRLAMPLKVECVAVQIRNGFQPKTEAERRAAHQAKSMGWVSFEDGQWATVDQRSGLIAYLPNSLVGDETGKATDESTVIDRIRMARDPMALHLLVHLYQAQDLAELGGVDREMLRMKFDRETIAATGQFQLWRFLGRQQWVTWAAANLPHKIKPVGDENPGARFFDRVNILEDAGALEWVYAVAEDETHASMPIYPVAVVRFGKIAPEEPESIVGAYALRAALALKGEPEMVDAWEGAGIQQFLLPTDRLAREAALVGIPRLHGRARTRNARRWQGDRIETCRKWIQAFRGIIADHAPELLAAVDTRFADFNGTSTLHQGGVQGGVQGGLQGEVNDSPNSAMHDSHSFGMATDGEPSAGEDGFQELNEWPPFSARAK